MMCLFYLLSAPHTMQFYEIGTRLAHHWQAAHDHDTSTFLQELIIDQALLYQIDKLIGGATERNLVGPDAPPERQAAIDLLRWRIRKDGSVGTVSRAADDSRATEA